MPDSPPATPFLYFSYGSNLDADRIRMHCPSARLMTIARREGYRFAYSAESKNTWHGGVGDMRSSPGDEVWGALWLINATESDALDEQEGLLRVPPVYERVMVEVVTPAGDVVRCRSYVVAAPNVEGFLPSPAYKDTVLRSARTLGFPAAYIARLEAVPDNGGMRR